jgi:hypothetical protein
MTSCILYGLTLARWLQGAVFAANQRQRAANKNPHELAASYAALCLLPLLGVILSVLLIGKSVHSAGSWRVITIYVVNLAAAIAAFFILGGHGIKLAEEGGDRDDTAK